MKSAYRKMRGRKSTQPIDGLFVQLKRPSDSRLSQQKLRPICSDFNVLFIAIFLILVGVVFIPAGYYLQQDSDNTFQTSFVYDEGETSTCYISVDNENRQCQITFDIDQDVTGPIYVYYKVDNFFQNHRRYFQSKSATQLAGEDLLQSAVELDCNPLYLNGTQLLNPCGLVANSYFNDVISLDSAASTPQGVVMNESSISVLSDREEKYKQVTGFEYAIVTDANTTCSEANLPEGCKTYNDTATNTLYKFYYPRDDVVQYLYESYPQVSPIKGVTDEHFIVWMRTSFLPSFRNLYGVIHGNFVKGDKFVFTVNANYEVDSFNGQKSIVLTTMNNFGGKNPVLGETYKTTGSFGLIVGVFLIIKELLLL